MMKRYRKTSLSQYVVIGLILLGIGSFTFISTVVMQRVSFEDQFVIPWAAGRFWLLEGMNPYDNAVIEAASEIISESSYLATLPESAELVEPMISLVFYLPFSLIPYGISRALWVTLIAFCLGMIGHLSIRLSGWKTNPVERIVSLLLPLIIFPGVMSVLTGHLSPMIILLILVALILVLNGQEMTAGFILALIFSSIQTVGLFLITLMVWSISRKRWSLISAFLSGLAFIIIIFWLLVPTWPLRWLGVLINTYDGWDWISTPLMHLSTLLPGIAYHLSIFLHAGFVLYVMVLWVSLIGKGGLELLWKIFTICVVAYLLHVQSAPYQLFLVFPAMFMVFRFLSERWGILGRLFTWIFMISLIAGSWLLVLPEIDFTGDIAMPAITVGFPLIVFIGMIWIRWWALKVPRVDYKL